MKVRGLVYLSLLLLGTQAFAWNPVTDIRNNVVWTFGKAADGGSGYDFSAKKWRASALAEIVEYRFLAASYGATFFNERTPEAVDTFKVGLLSNFFFNLFINKPTPEMAWMQNLNVGPSYAIPVFSGETGHKGVFLLDINYRFGGVSAPTTSQ